MGLSIRTLACPIAGEAGGLRPKRRWCAGGWEVQHRPCAANHEGCLCSKGNSLQKEQLSGPGCLGTNSDLVK